MSERLKVTNNISNEEVIDDLTKDLEFSLRSDDDAGINASYEASSAASGDSAFASPSGMTHSYISKQCCLKLHVYE